MTFAIESWCDAPTSPRSSPPPGAGREGPAAEWWEGEVGDTSVATCILFVRETER